MKKKISVFLFLILICTLLAGCTSPNESFTSTGFYFDTSVTITLYGESKDYSDEIMEICEKYDEMLDRYNPDSLLSQLNTSKSAATNEDFLNIFNLVDEYSIDGTFDLTVAPFLDLWGFGPENDSSDEAGAASKVPSNEQISSLLEEAAGYGYTIDPDTYETVLAENTVLETGGVAKGYTGDRIAEFLEEKGVSSALLSLGTSTMMLIGSKPDGSDYKIGLQTPFEETGTYDYVFEGNSVCLSTSGSYERYFEEDGKIYHQIIDMSTGRPADSGLNAVTVITDGGAKADILSTSLFILGLDAGLEYVESNDGIEAIFFDTENNITLSSGLVMNDNVISLK